MPHIQESRVWCRSISQLSHLAEQFVTENGTESTDMKLLLQQCVDTLSNYQDECKKIKSVSKPVPSKELYDLYETAYVYFKIVSLIVLNKIPKLEEYARAKSDAVDRTGKQLLEIYNMLVNRLVKDDRIAEIKRFVKENSRRDPEAKNEQIGVESGKSIPATLLRNLLMGPSASGTVLLVDVRPRLDFMRCHIKSSSIICIEPVSFKESYTDIDLGKKSMITSPDAEIALFQDRDKFDYIVVYTQDSEKNKHNVQQQQLLVDLLINRSFEKALDRTKVFILAGGFSEWSNAHPDFCVSSQGDSVYLNGDTSGLSLQLMPQTTPQKQYNNMFQTMLSGPTDVHGIIRNPHNFPTQQKSKLKRVPSFRDYFRSSSSSSNINERPGSVPPQLSNGSTIYPETPKLMTNDEYMKSLPQLSPITARAITSPSRALSAVGVSKSSASNSISSLLANSGSASPMKPPDTPLPFTDSIKTLGQQNLTVAVSNLNFSVGLVNCGNSCYMSCIIQCLLGTQELCTMFLNNSYQNHINLNSRLGSKGLLARYFSQLIHQMYQYGKDIRKKMGNEKTAVIPTQFKIACGSINSSFKDNTQQDCQEFCQFLLDGLHEDLNQCGNNPPLKELSEEAEKMREMMPMRLASAIEWERYLTTDFSVIVDLFQGQYASQLQCKVCQRTSTTYQPFSVLSVPVPSTRTCTLTDCFTEFTKIETLEQEEQWSCPSCKKRQPSTKKITITRLPRNLIIHLKRFDNMLNKNNVFVSYPSVLDLTAFWANDYDKKVTNNNVELPSRGQVPPFNYQLYGIACHDGTLRAGHYTAYVNKGAVLGWCYYDDTNWRQIRSAREYITQNAYVLFYHRIHST
ncbi:AFR007Wp [Eremothecium gossypii ATCC 10895]|uniref:Ubiquitin carboxyl-terminal hydrolase 4 n=1 Tax=Eremothecium gossypii (strain ATCC 10895 / CBS 109.51 / FGSC 9923 / NRRL Y-1056) TaxID=284811 RepID=UBP4_EREGS|nr:AFR007Wp [Eremothecium gossypii ATCC 10895]Q754R5.2 RecName: Full=Ubiquitin carboxyl-terminal hydrolase 4; AltName: Full=Deubiquitinating enzyme 4; AltName: Full=Ubiquitin thioesterase 4; AltName: Full=Ubiquitin-specific-processing protease 4 [Eremothecium gossypii ATCC 10895]AAS53378.2 AFR007Wp [Eremothecium gossypii ATCC 10895]AEY97689.1 FAFR007Wp [Eremothecium gossypii FDAG1]